MSSHHADHAGTTPHNPQKIMVKSTTSPPELAIPKYMPTRGSVRLRRHPKRTESEPHTFHGAKIARVCRRDFQNFRTRSRNSSALQLLYKPPGRRPAHSMPHDSVNAPFSSNFALKLLRSHAVYKIIILRVATTS